MSKVPISQHIASNYHKVFTWPEGLMYCTVPFYWAFETPFSKNIKPMKRMQAKMNESEAVIQKDS